jgi:hypothetical protein
MRSPRFAALLIAALVLVSVPALSQPSFTARYGSDQAGAGWTPFAPKFTKRTVEAESGDGSLADVIASAVFDLDATQAASYGGSGTTWTNLVTAPADGSAQTAYDFHLGLTSGAAADDPTFTGSAGSSAAYFALDGADFFDFATDTTTTAFLKNLHKTTGGQEFWIAVGVRVIAGSATQCLYGYRTTTATSQGIRFEITSSERLSLAQGNGTATVSGTSATTLSSGTDYLLIVSAPAGGGTIRFWFNTLTAEEISLTYGATSTDPSVSSVPKIAACGAGTGQNIMNNTTRIYSAAMGNEYLDNTKAAAIIAALEARHGRDYTP